MQALLVTIFLAAAGAGLIAQNVPSQPASGSPATSGGGATISALTGQVIPPPANSSQTATNSPTRVLPNPAAAAAQANTHAFVTNRSRITPAQMQNINRLVVDLNALSLPSKDTVEQMRGLRQTLTAAASSNARPTDASLSQLGSALAAVVPSLNLTAPQRRQLAIDINLALNSGSLTAEEARRVVADAQGLLHGSAVKNPDGVGHLMDSMAAIVAELRNNSGSQTGAIPAETPASIGQPAESQTGQGAGASTPTTGNAPISR